MIITNDMICSTIILAKHPLGGIAASSVKTKFRDISPKPKISSWAWPLGGHNEFKEDYTWESPLECIQRETKEEGYLIPQRAKLTEVYRGMKPIFKFVNESSKRHFMFYSVVVCNIPLELLDEYPEKEEGVEHLSLLPEEIPLIWRSEDSDVIQYIAKLVLEGKDIKPINLTENGWVI